MLLSNKLFFAFSNKYRVTAWSQRNLIRIMKKSWQTSGCLNKVRFGWSYNKVSIDENVFGGWSDKPINVFGDHACLVLLNVSF